ncbi:hypothetical protein CY35_06G029300 [Sphagnum magellanicum]|jgi:hypothetical protein|nr:hypothetical protein CY35_06G029300 [Sphagnum magellanicum]
MEWVRRQRSISSLFYITQFLHRDNRVTLRTRLLTSRERDDSRDDWVINNWQDILPGKLREEEGGHCTRFNRKKRPCGCATTSTEFSLDLLSIDLQTWILANHDEK